MEGAQGRKNLVWIAQSFPSLSDGGFGAPKARTLLAQANIAMYPVMVRSPAVVEALRKGWRDFGKSVGGAAFDDAGNALDAIGAAEEDSKKLLCPGFLPR